MGDGPARAMLEAQYPDAHFLGALSGRALAGAYAGADVFVFPSRTDTFGLVMIEALWRRQGPASEEQARIDGLVEWPAAAVLPNQ